MTLERSPIVDEIADALKIASLRRYDESEFQFEIAQRDETVGDRRHVVRYLVTVKRGGQVPISYACGPGQAWVAKFSDDLAAGRYG